MNNFLNKKRFTNFFFLLYFLVYAITPLSYSFINKSSGNSLLDKSQYNTTNFHLYTLDVICSYISNLSSAQSNDFSSQFILLRKKRAILPEEDLQKSLKPVHCAVINNDGIFFESPVLSSFVLNKETKPSKSFSSSFSGLSPPYV